MELTVEVPAVRQVQVTDFYCGAACAAMLLASLGRKVTQDAAYERIRAANAEPGSFYTDPEGLTVCLEGVLARQRKDADFEFETPADPSKVLAAALQSLSTDRLPVPVLVKAGAHWVLIDGMILDRKVDEDTIKTVMIVDPWPSARERSHIPADVFRDEYLKPIRFGTRWRDQRVVVGRIDTPATRDVRVVEQPELGGGAKPDDLSAAARLADLGIRGATPVLAGGIDLEPIEVTDLSGGPDYVIRPLDGTATEGFEDFILVAHDALTGKILEVTRFDSRLSYFTDAEALALLADEKTAGEPTVDPGYFFFPSRRLRTRFLVARRVRIAGKVHWLMPGGELLSHQDVFEKGGQ